MIIGDKEDVEGKIINLLNDSITPSLTDFEVEFDKNLISCISPMPTKSSHITRGEPFTMFALLKNEIEDTESMSTTVKVSYYDSVSRSRDTRIFELCLEGCITDSTYHKMCIKSLVESREIKAGIYYMEERLKSVNNIEALLAVAYQVLTPKLTAFICLIEKNKNGKMELSKDVIQPSMQSIDYGDVQVGGKFGVRMRKGGARTSTKKMSKTVI